MDALLPHPLPRPRHTRTSRRGPHLPPAPRPHPTRTRTRSGDGLSKTCFTDDAAVVVPNGADGAPFEGEWLPRGGLSLVEKLEHFPGSVGWARMLVKDHSAVGHEFPVSLEWSSVTTDGRDLTRSGGKRRRIVSVKRRKRLQDRGVLTSLHLPPNRQTALVRNLPFFPASVLVWSLRI